MDIQVVTRPRRCPKCDERLVQTQVFSDNRLHEKRHSVSVVYRCEPCRDNYVYTR